MKSNVGFVGLAKVAKVKEPEKVLSGLKTNIKPIEAFDAKKEFGK